MYSFPFWYRKMLLFLFRQCLLFLSSVTCYLLKLKRLQSLTEILLSMWIIDLIIHNNIVYSVTQLPAINTKNTHAKICCEVILREIPKQLTWSMNGISK